MEHHRPLRAGRWTLGVVLMSGFLVSLPGCSRAQEETPPEVAVVDHADARRKMVAEQLETRGITDPSVLNAMRNVPRHRFIPDAVLSWAYADGPLDIGEDQTISQPYIVALMTELIAPGPEMKILEVGTGSGYQAAVLAQIVDRVYSVEILPDLADSARAVLADLDIANVEVRTGDGYDGWPEQAPFDAIIVTAAPPSIPQPLLDQLATGGRLVIPVGRRNQDLLVVTRTEDGFERQTVTGVRFVPMTGKIEDPPL